MAHNEAPKVHICSHYEKMKIGVHSCLIVVSNWLQNGLIKYSEITVSNNCEHLY